MAMVSKIEAMSEAEAGDIGPGQYNNETTEYQDNPDDKDRIPFTGCTEKDCLESPVCAQCLETVLAEIKLDEHPKTEQESMRDVHDDAQINATNEEATRGESGEEATRSVLIPIAASMYSQNASHDVSEKRPERPVPLAKVGARVPQRSGGELQDRVREPAANTDGECEPSEETTERAGGKELITEPRTTPPASAAANRTSSILSRNNAPDETYPSRIPSPQIDVYIAVSSHIAERGRFLPTGPCPEIQVLLCARDGGHKTIFKIFQPPGENSKHPSNRVEILLLDSRPRSLRLNDLESIGGGVVVFPPLFLLSLGTKLRTFRRTEVLSVAGGVDKEADIEYSSQPGITHPAALFEPQRKRQAPKFPGDNVASSIPPLLHSSGHQEPTVCGEPPPVVQLLLSDNDDPRDLSKYVSRGLSSTFQLINDYFPARLLAFFSLFQLSNATSTSSSALGAIPSLPLVELAGTTLNAFAFLSFVGFLDRRIGGLDKIKLGALLQFLAYLAWQPVNDASGGYQLGWIPILFTFVGLVFLCRGLFRVRGGCSKCGKESCGGDCGSGSSTGGEDHV